MLDVTHPDAAEQSQTVENTLAELGLAHKPRITVLNKVDLLAHKDGHPIEGLEELRGFEPSLHYWRPEAVLVSALKGWGLDELLWHIERALARKPMALGEEGPRRYRAAV